MNRWKLPFGRVWLPIFFLCAAAAEGGVPQVGHRLEGLRYTVYRQFGRLSIRFAGGIPVYRLQESKDGSWTITFESTTAVNPEETLSNDLVQRVWLERRGAATLLRLAPVPLQGIDVQPVRQGDLLLLDLLPRSESDPGERLFHRGVMALEEGHPERALEYLREWLRQHPGDARAYFHAGRARLALGHLAKARYNLLRAARDSTWRREVSRMLAALEGPPKVDPQPAARAEFPDSSAKTQTAAQDSLANVPAVEPSQPTKPVVLMPSVKGSSVVMLLAIPLMVATATTAGIAWLILRRKRRPRTVRTGLDRRFGEYLSFSSDAKETLEALKPEATESEAAVLPAPPVPQERPRRPADDLFLPLNQNEKVRFSTKESDPRLKASLRQLLESMESGSDLREVARYLDVGLAEVELARSLAQYSRVNGQAADEDAGRLRFRMVDK